MKKLSLSIVLLTATIFTAGAQIIKLTDVYEDYEQDLIKTVIITNEGTSAQDLKNAMLSWATITFKNYDEALVSTDGYLSFEGIMEIESQGNYLIKFVAQFKDDRFRLQLYDLGAKTGPNYKKPISQVFKPKFKKLTGAEYLEKSVISGDYDIVNIFVTKTNEYTDSLQKYIDNYESDW